MGIEVRGEFDVVGGLSSQVGGRWWRGRPVAGVGGVGGGGRLACGEAWGFS